MEIELVAALWGNKYGSHIKTPNILVNPVQKLDLVVCISVQTVNIMTQSLKLPFCAIFTFIVIF